MDFSIIIVSTNRKKVLQYCLQSVQKQVNEYKAEVIVILNGDISFLEKYRQQFPNFNFYYFKQTTTGNCLNFALKLAKGKNIFFLKDNCILPNKYFESISLKENWDVLSGPSIPITNTNIKMSNENQLIAKAYTNPVLFGLGIRQHSKKLSYRSPQSIEEINFHNIWIRKEIFTHDYYCFKEAGNHAFPQMVYQLLNKKKRFLLNPNLYVQADIKLDYDTFLKTCYRNATWRTRFFSKTLLGFIMVIYPLLLATTYALIIFNPSVTSAYIFALINIFLFTAIFYYEKKVSLRLILLNTISIFAFSAGIISGMIFQLKKLNYLIYKKFIHK